MKISIAIPAYEYGGFGEECLEHSFKQMLTQTFRDFDVVVSDSSVTSGDIRKLCDKWKNKLDIKYFRSKEAIGNPAANMNNAVRNATGDWVKILCQDDFLSSDTSLETLEKAIDEKHKWLATGYLHTYDRKNFENYHFPYLNPRIYVINTVGTPSCVTIKNDENIMEFDENLSYCYDCEFYYRYFLEYGVPKIVEDVTIANYLWEESITHRMTTATIEQENNYILRKHGFMNENRE